MARRRRERRGAARLRGGRPSHQGADVPRPSRRPGGDLGTPRGARDRLRRRRAPLRLLRRLPEAANRAEVAAAEVVVAAHQALFTGFAVEAGSIAAIVIDEGHWSSAVRDDTGIGVEAFAHELLGHSLGRRDAGEAIADLHDLRGRAVAAFADCGPVARSRLLGVGLDEATCRLAAELEARRLRDPGLHPGMPAEDRGRAAAQAAVNARTHGFIELWRAMAELAAGATEHDGRLHVRRSRDGAREVVVAGVRAIHPTLRDKPILHLDATLRPALATSVLPGLEVHEVDAAMPHMALRLIAGSFGKSSLCADPGLDPAEAQRRSNRLAEVVDYVRWQARRVAPGKVLVVTYKSCEAAFEEIAGVETGHFNAIAGLDAYRDVRLLVVVGRPLPSDAALAPLAGALFRHLPAGGYGQTLRGVRMRDGSSRGVRVRCHADDEGRAAARRDLRRRGAAGDRPWPWGQPQRRRSARGARARRRRPAAGARRHRRVGNGAARPPPAHAARRHRGRQPQDAAVLHPSLFSNGEQAKKAFRRSGFKGQNPIRNTYREMSLKSAAYRRPGSGCGWQRAWWIAGEADAARCALEAALGALAEWRPES